MPFILEASELQRKHFQDFQNEIFNSMFFFLIFSTLSFRLKSVCLVSPIFLPFLYFAPLSVLSNNHFVKNMSNSRPKNLVKNRCIFLFSDEELFGDFEDLEVDESALETKEDQENSGDDDEGAESDEGDDEEKRLAKKKKLKEAFNSEYLFIFKVIYFKL